MANGNFPALLTNAVIKNRFNEVLGRNAASFMSALLNIYQGNKALQSCDGRTILGAAGQIAILNLSITPSLGQAYVVPYRGQATFQIGYKGLIQLAHRTGKFTRLHAGKVCEGEIAGFNPITGEPQLGEKVSDKVIGYVAYMRLNNGFEKALFMTLEEIEEHALKYSQSYKTDKNKGWSSSPWTTNFEAMANKTVLKKLLNTWGILSAEMATAIQADQSVVDKNSFTYVDNGGTVQSREEIYLPEETPTTDVETVETPEELKLEAE